MTPPDPSSIFFTTRDALRLHVRRYDAAGSLRPPVLCLAGLTRNSRDFHDLARALSTGAEARTVWALDSRGRGLSDFDPSWRNYNVLVETHDVIDLAAMAGLHGATIIGTSRGGLLAMILAAMQPNTIGAVVLNDIGPVIEAGGLARIAGYVGRTPLPGSWKEAAALAANLGRQQFADVSGAQWEEIARAWYNDKDGRPAPGYDPAIARLVSAAPGTIPQLWPQFLALSKVPVLVVRGENSDILGTATLEEMQRRHPRCTALAVPRQGHAPLLRDSVSIEAIARFVATAEAGGRVTAIEHGR